MSGIAFDFTVNLPMLGGGSVFLVTIGHQLGKIATKLDYLSSWHEQTSDNVKDLNGRVSHIEGHLGIDK